MAQVEKIDLLQIPTVYQCLYTVHDCCCSTLLAINVAAYFRPRCSSFSLSSCGLGHDAVVASSPLA